MVKVFQNMDKIIKTKNTGSGSMTDLTFHDLPVKSVDLSTSLDPADKPRDVGVERQLKQYAREIIDSNVHSAHSEQFKVRSESIEIDYSCQRVSPEIVELLIERAKECNLKEKINALLDGDRVNESQQIPALHTALRIMEPKSFLVNGVDIMPDIMAVRSRMALIARQIRSGEWLGFSGKPITSIVNIGIGGSDFGPRFCLSALSDHVVANLDFYFISDADPKAFDQVVQRLKPETTLFIISSKSFTTYETLHNAKKALAWVNNRKAMDKHFIAVTAQVKKAEEFGISNVLPIWSWVGGRYSLCSAINLITCIAIGFDAFMELLAGAHSMDKHFQEKEFHENMPVLLGLLGIWNINYLQTPSLLFLVYAKQLELFVPYVQQLDMESNGKCFDKAGNKITYTTGPIIWGGLGNQAQHSYYQLLSQSNHKLAADFISLKENDAEPINRFCEEQIHVLSRGASFNDYPSGEIAGGMPINHIKMKACTPYNLGALVALYEHKVYVQSVLWYINPFDQPGVESAKLVTQRLRS